MSGFTLPRFAKTNGRTQKSTEVGVESPQSTRSPSFFSSLKSKLSKSSRSMGSTSFDAENELPDDKTYFRKTAGSSTMARNINAFSWGGHSSSLQQCAADGDLDGVKRLLNLGEDVNGVDENGNTALHFAAEGGFEELASELLVRGANANLQNDDGDMPLHKATINNCVDLIAVLVAGNADVNAQSTTGWTALHEAACNGRLEAAQTLLHLGADVNKRTREGDTSLHKAARWGRVEIVKLLLVVGADAHARDKLGREPLQRTNVEEIVQLLKKEKRQQARHEGSSDQGQRESSPKRSQPRTEGEEKLQQEGHEEWDLADQRELYEVQWTLFASNKNPERKVTYSDVPWPGISTSPKDVLQVVLYGTTTAEEKKRRLRSELLRWHPDKFQALFGRNLKVEDADQIMAKVKDISQALSVLWSESLSSSR